MAAVGAVAGAAAIGAGRLGKPGDLPAYLTGLALAAGSSLAGFGLLQRGVRLRSRGFVGLLLAVFLGRVALVAAFGLALLVLAPAHLASGLLSLVAYHFFFAVAEVVLLARAGAAGRGAERKTRTLRSG